MERVEKPEAVKDGTYWLCVCQCGNKKIINAGKLKSGETKSCGCLRKESTRQRSLIDLTGNKYGKLCVENFSHIDRFGHSIWLCKCICGGYTLASGDNLTRNHTTSCGCSRISAMKKIGERKRLCYGEACLNALFYRYKLGAKRRNFIFNISREIFQKKTSENCSYCGSSPKQIQRGGRTNGDYTYNGLDRIDSSKGYTEDNVVPCCGRCNEAKMATDQKEFLDWNERVIIHQSKKWTDEQIEEFVLKIKSEREKEK